MRIVRLARPMRLPRRSGYWERDTVMNELPKYPRTAYWPDSPSIAPGDRYVESVEPFIGHHVVLTEKLDGSNTLLHRGQALGRSASPEAHDPWRAMVRKHHAWKVQEHDVLLYGEDIFGIHSITYGPVLEDRTFYAFALRQGDQFAGWEAVVAYARSHDIPVVPVLHYGIFESRASLTDFLDEAHASPSLLGGDREGIVIRRAESFRIPDFGRFVCKSVRENHVQTDQHWTRNWQPCALISE